MRTIMGIVTLLMGVAWVLAFVGCGPTAFVRGQYDNVNRVNLLNDQWSETDMQKAVASLVKSLEESHAIADAHRPPIVMVTRLQNKTDEHIDTQSIMDMVKVELMKHGRVRFIDKEARGAIAKEYKYENSGMVSATSRKGPGGQTGADYILDGRLDSIVQQAGNDKTVYYKLTLNLTNLETGVTSWSDNKQLRKVYHKRSVGL